jgi:formylglycine-generating enzyme required for sulfatase activity
MLVGAAALGCHARGSDKGAPVVEPALEPAVTSVVATLKPPASPDRSVTGDAGAPPLIHVNELEPAAPPEACPSTMVYIAGGEFWMGSARGRGAGEERPRFLTRVADFCLDTYEVTSASYQHCVSVGECKEPRATTHGCNYGRREDHPINCVDWSQADAYCRSQGARLPTELEWEYAARGGSNYFPFSWGYDAPDERACWKGSQTCPVGSYAPGAFGLHDMSGNVWEWTNDWFGDYPWPQLSGSAKVFRGGGWNRRTDGSLVTTLRNRATPSRSGSYLGFRCARLAKDARCPFGPGDAPGLCRHGVLDADCESNQRFNGQRCAEPDAPPCGLARDLIAGHGCVPRPGDPALDALEVEPPARASTPERRALKLKPSDRRTDTRR